MAYEGSVSSPEAEADRRERAQEFKAELRYEKAVKGFAAKLSPKQVATPHVAGTVALCHGEAGAQGPCAGLAPADIVQRMRDDAQAATQAAPSYGFTGDPTRPVGRYYGFLATAGPLSTTPTTPPPRRAPTTRSAPLPRARASARAARRATRCGSRRRVASAVRCRRIYRRVTCSVTSVLRFAR